MNPSLPLIAVSNISEKINFLLNLEAQRENVTSTNISRE